MGLTSDTLRASLENARQEHGYSTTSFWHRQVRSALSCLELAQQSVNAKDEFSNLWLAVNHLYKMAQESSEEENKAAGKWGNIVVESARVREALLSVSKADLNFIKSAENKLLWDFNAKKQREGRNMLDAWIEKRSPSAEQSIQYLLGIGRDCRNAVFHANFDPGTTQVRKALEALARIIKPFTEAAVEATIQHPLPGTTGKAPTYRGFLWPYLTNADNFFSDYYLKQRFPEEELGAGHQAHDSDDLKFPSDDIKDSFKALRKAYEEFVLNGGEVLTWCELKLFPLLGIKPSPSPKLIWEKQVVQPTYVISSAENDGALSEEVSGKEAADKVEALIWVIPYRNSLAASYEIYDPQADEEIKKLTLIEVAHRTLMGSDISWAILTNGSQLRLLHKSNAHKPQCFLEIDLAAILARTNEPRALLAFRYFLGLFSGESFTVRKSFEGELRNRLERIRYLSDRYGKEIGDELKQNAFQALEELGNGFINYCREHPDEVEEWRKKAAPDIPIEGYLESDSLLKNIYHESLTLLYRLLFLFYAESRGLLPLDNDIYRESYSLESIRDEVRNVLDSPDKTKHFFAKGNTHLWDRLHELFSLMNTGSAPLNIGVYNGGLFDPEQHVFLTHFKVGDGFFSRSIDLLSRTQPKIGQSRKKVTYRDLDVRHLGSIYEGILEYFARIADEDLALIKRGSGNKTEEEYAPISDLNGEEKKQLAAYLEAMNEGPQNPKLPRGCKITGYKEKGQYYLVHGGRESKRKSSGSYYTPDYIVQYIVENTLGPIIRGETREDDLKNVPLTSDEILELKILDPAMGSGHFLVAAIEYLARAYGEALIREGKDQDGVMTEDEFIRYKRKVAERCIYGVDINPMAVELAKLSLWLFTMDKDRPLSFLDHHLKCGNSLVGGKLEDLGGPLFLIRFREKLPLMISDLFGIMKQETISYDDIKFKKTLDKSIEELKLPFKNVADMWTGRSFGEEATEDYLALVSDLQMARERKSSVADEYKFFHWELEFPEVFYDKFGRDLDNSGFDVVVGNPPYVRQELLAKFKNYVKQHYSTYNSTADLFVYFIERSIVLLCPRGHFSIIVSSSFLRTAYASPLRQFIRENSAIINFVDFGGVSVFPNAKDTYVCIPLFSKRSQPDKIQVCKVNSLNNDELMTHVMSNRYLISESRFVKEGWSLEQENKTTIFEKICSRTITLSQYVKGQIFYGIKTGLNKAFEIDESSQKSIIQNAPHCKIFLKRLLGGQNIKRYYAHNSNKYLIVIPSGWTAKQIAQKKALHSPISESEAWVWFSKEYEPVAVHLTNFMEAAKSRQDKGEFWWELRPCDYYPILESSKIIYPDIAKGPRFYFDTSGTYIANTAYCLGANDLYLLGILNSRLSWFAIGSVSIPFGTRAGEFRYRLIYQYMEKLPIHPINFSDPVDKVRHDRMVELVERMLDLHKQLSQAKAQKQASIQQLIDDTDRQIDRLVYELYGLTEEEIKIVEESTK